MLALDIISDVIQKDREKKHSALGGVGLNSAFSGGAVGSLLVQATMIGSTYAVGRQVYKDQYKTISKDEGVDSSWTQSLLTPLGGAFVGTVVSMFLPTGIKDIGVGSQSADSLVKKAFDAADFFASAYHGYKRHNDSIMWGLGWGFFGSLGLAFSQHYAKPIRVRSNPDSLAIERRWQEEDALGITPIANPRKRKSSRKMSKAIRTKTSAQTASKRKSAKKSSKKSSKKSHRRSSR